MDVLLAPAGIRLIGVIVEFVAVVLVGVLVMGLQHRAGDRGYLPWWNRALVALLVSLLAMGLRYGLEFGLSSGDESLTAVVGFLPTAIHHVAKLLFVGWVALGVIVLARERPATRIERSVVPAVATVIGVAVAAFSDRFQPFVMAQAAVAVPAAGFAAWRLLGIKESKRGLGTTILLLALGWMVLSYGFYWAGIVVADGPAGRMGGWLGILLSYSAFIDTAQVAALGVGMALALVEQGHREEKETEQERVTDATTEQERITEVLRAAHDGIVTLRADRTIDLMNRAAEAMLGVEATQVRGQPFDQFLKIEAGRLSLWSQMAVRTRRSEANPDVAVRHECIGWRANGDEFPLEVAASTFGDGAGRGWVLVLRDLTEQIRARHEYHRMQDELAQAARLEAVGRMVSGVAHELNNPLTAIIAFSQDLMATAQSEEDREAVTTINQQAERCRVIVSDLLVFARSRREERRRIDPAELVARVTRVFEREAAARQIELDVAIAPDLPSIEVDVTGIEQVLTNLLTNALQASPAGDTVGVGVFSRDSRVVFQVDDAGPGIAPEIVLRLFEPFFTTKPEGHGTGLGLSVSHAIVDQHGGTITAENRPTGGARFTIELPMVDRRLPPLLLTAQEAEIQNALAAEQPGRVLIVDDEASIRSAMRRAFERRGWLVDEAADGGEAWLRIEVGGRAVDYDAVVTDLRMPGVSGMELYDKLRALYPELAARTIVITGDTTSPGVVEFLERLETPVLQKPFDLRRLIDLVGRGRQERRRETDFE